MSRFRPALSAAALALLASCASQPTLSSSAANGTLARDAAVVTAPTTLRAGTPGAAGMRDDFPAELRQIVTAAIADHATPGAGVAIGRNGLLVVDGGYGTIDWAGGAAAVTDSTLYDMASLTKVIATTTAAMLMEEDGKLDIDRTVVSYVPEFNAPDKANITVRNLLLHSSGMKQTVSLWKESKTRAEFLRRINDYPLAYRPGEKSDYTDWNMMVMQAVIERVSGRPLDSLVAERVFRPLGMRDTRFNPPSTLKYRIAPTETQDFRGGQVWGVVHDENAWVLGGVSGHAGLFSSARDLAVFAQMMLNGGEYNGVRVLKPETIARWTARQTKVASRALGWDTPSPRSSAGRYFSPRSWGHTGFTGTSIWIDPEKQLFVVLLTNRVNPTRNNQKIGPLRRDVADAAQRAIVNAPLRLWERDTTTTTAR